MKKVLLIVLVVALTVAVICSCSPDGGSGNGKKEETKVRTFDSLDITVARWANQIASSEFDGFAFSDTSVTDVSKYFTVTAWYSSYPTSDDVTKKARIYAQNGTSEKVQVTESFTFEDGVIYSVWAEYTDLDVTHTSKVLKIKGAGSYELLFLGKGKRTYLVGTTLAGLESASVRYFKEDGSFFADTIALNTKDSSGNYILKVVQCDKDKNEITEFKADTDTLQKNCAYLRISTAKVASVFMYVPINALEYSECDTTVTGGIYSYDKVKAGSDFYLSSGIGLTVSKSVDNVKYTALDLSYSSFTPENNKIVKADESEHLVVQDGWEIEILNSSGTLVDSGRFEAGSVLKINIAEKGEYTLKVTCVKPEKVGLSSGTVTGSRAFTVTAS